MNRWRAMSGQRTDPEQLQQFYLENRSTPGAILQWAEQNVGPQRALDEAERFSLNMERRIANGNVNPKRADPNRSTNGPVAD